MEARLCELYKSGEEYEIIERSVTFDILLSLVEICSPSFHIFPDVVTCVTFL